MYLVDGGWSGEEKIDSCSKSCGGGTQLYLRKCNSPPPSHGGKECYGPRVVQRPCNTDACPGMFLIFIFF